MAKLFLKKGNSWGEVAGVVDVRIQPGKFKLDNDQEVNGDLISIHLDLDRYDAGQTALRALVDMDPRIVDMRVEGVVDVELSVILCGDDVDPVRPSRFVINGRVLGIRNAGVDPTQAGRGGNVV